MRNFEAVLLATYLLNWANGVVLGQVPNQMALETRAKLRASVGSEIDAFPRVVANSAVSADVAAKINASLDRFEIEVLRDARACHKQEKELHASDGEELSDWQRSVQATMRGPHYLSLLAKDTYDCGGPHPLDDQTALVYDLKTGTPVSWARLLPPQATGEILRSPHRLAIGVVHWPALLQRARNQAGSDCAGAYSNKTISFTVWLSTKEHAVVFSPNLLIHYDGATCGEQVKLGVTEAKKLGVAPELVEALEAAQ